MKLLFTLALPVFLVSSAQAQLSRLMSQAHWTNNGAMFVSVDTTDYTYNSLSHGGDLKHTLKYDNSIKMLATDSSWMNSMKSQQDFYTMTDAAGAYADAIKSKINFSWNIFSGTWTIVDKYNYWYNSNGTTKYMIYQTWNGTSWTNVSQNVYGYSGVHLVSDKYMTWNGAGSFTLASQKIYINDGITGMVTDETDANVTGSTPTYTVSYHYDYDTANHLSVATYNVWDGISFVPNHQHSYTYDVSGNRLTDAYDLYNTTTSVFDHSTLKIYSNFTAGHNPQDEIDQNYDASGGGFYSNFMEFTYTYNSYEQMTSLVGISWNAAGFWEYISGDPAANYHYSPYSPASVATVSSNGQVNIFPIPAQNIINIKLNWNEAQSFTIAMYDMNGRMVQQTSVPTTSQYTTSIMTDNIPAGNYIVKIGGAKGQFTKEIVITH